MRGRRPQPAALKAAKGNPGKRAVAAATDALAPGGALKPLAKLRPSAASVWRELAPELERLNFLRISDRHAFGRYCETLAHYWEVTTAMRRAGGATYESKSEHGTLQRIHPLFIVQDRLFKRLTDLEDRFGLTPASRQAIMLRLASAQPSLPFGTPAQPAPQPEPAPESPIGLLGGGSVH